MPRLIRAAMQKAKLTGGSVATGVDVVGDLAIVRLPVISPRQKKRFAEALMEETGRVKGVFEQEGGIEGEFRLRTLKHIAGSSETVTLHRENGCAYRVDIAKCYFSPRLSTERLRVAQEVKSKERVLNMFAGVGPFSIPVAKLAKARVTSCELNGYAVQFHLENNKLNKVADLVRVIEADASDLPKMLDEKFDRILMPHPSKADKFIGTALELAEKRATVHYYRHVLGRDEEEGAGVVKDELSEVLPPKSRVRVRRVRDVGPRWLEMVAEIRLPA